ncbi:16693_t:CDS:2 [Funneliformis geosporum]|nr:16693_t:CDS:2 [Funneliformis geosporum]
MRSPPSDDPSSKDENSMKSTKGKAMIIKSNNVTISHEFNNNEDQSQETSPKTLKSPVPIPMTSISTILNHVDEDNNNNISPINHLTCSSSKPIDSEPCAHTSMNNKQVFF